MLRLKTANNKINTDASGYRITLCLGILKHPAIQMILGLLFIVLSAAHLQADSAATPLAPTQTPKNSLSNALSPYLQQHANDPIAWQPWSSLSLAMASKKNRPILLSIGYSSCHWCHVMAKESFQDPILAKFINNAFIAVKVDREEMPDIDLRYMTALKLMKNEAGWPITAVLTSKGDPIFIDSYMQKQALERLLQRIHTLWQTNSQVLKHNAERLTHQVNQQLQPASNLYPALSQSEIDNLTALLASKMDWENAGVRNGPKFPSAHIYQTLFAQAAETYNEELKQSIYESIHFLATSPLFDPIDGGFHRYTEDTQFHLPHYEKMLYTQGFMLSLLSTAQRYQPNADLEYSAKKTLNFLTNIFSHKGLYYSAMDADDHQGREGYYFSFDIQTLGLSEAMIKQSGLVAYPLPHYSKRRVFAFNTSPVSEMLTEQLQTLRRHNQSKTFVDKKIITAWNAIAIIGILDAAEAFEHSEWQRFGLNSLHTLLSTNQKLFTDLNLSTDNSRGTISRYSLEGKVANVPAQLEDLAWLILACTRAYDITSKPHWLTKAEKLYEQMHTRFFSPSYGRFKLADTADANFNAQDQNYPSPEAVALLSKKALFRRTGKLTYQENTLPHSVEQIKRQITEYSSLLLTQLHYRPYKYRYFAEGNGKITLKNNTLIIQLADGWHINSNKPIDKNLIPTRIWLDGNAITQYPKANWFTTDFSKAPLSVYKKETTFRIRQGSNTNRGTEYDSAHKAQQVKIQLQACNRTLCLAPENFHL
ncbi:MAG: DUF255 domain-containing protein [Cellvibrionales bacterium]|nr:DUF255 domain-containing protein [Cellvibrionales bacterium]